jgi:hypothetical protein
LDSLRDQLHAGLASPAVTEGAQVLAKELIQASRGGPAPARPRAPSKKPNNKSNPSSKKAASKRRRRDG